ncbi:hypothetical protein [Streptosporangium sp. 'caverna']|uniref:hypothetical protein n=1 Tax=Streptosporangium sp. 'caverna' TaxID=2202249 RepID=UPI000D7D7AC3|nr:hypothetical protein [Streptosporangium sp. 'caverna']AWS45307.1 hypothetical protein DKM19_32290 [Streptosporangium sp. 'caverna']
MRLRMVMASLVLVVASTTVVPAWAAPEPGSIPGSGSGSETAAAEPGLASVSAGPGPGSAGSAVPAVAGCDPIAGTECLLPFPNDWFTTKAHTPTGLRVNFSAEAMPRNTAGTPINPAQWNTADGFSPGSMLLAHVPGIDLAKTGAAPVTDVGWSLRRDAPIVIVDTRTGERWPYWTELDAGATDPARRMLIIRPAKNFLEGHRYAVALRRLKNAAGEDLPVPEGFAALLDGGPPAGDLLVRRQRELRQTLGDLARAGVNAQGLHLAWDFTVASEQGIAGPVLAMRDQALSALRGRSPRFTVTTVTDLTPEQDPNVAREVAGEITVPNFLDRPGGPPGSNLNRGPGGLPRPLGDSLKAQYLCEIPRSAFERPAHPSLYGHGLLGKATEVRARNVRAMAGEHGFMFCATKWIGMADEDVSNVASVFGDFSKFGTVTDRLQQSLLNFVLLGRAMITRDGFAGHKAFQDKRGRSLIDRRAELAYDGNSQGGIAGGALVAVSPDVRNAVLGVTGMNYSTLLNRSVDFEPFQQLMNDSYPDRQNQQLCFALIQMLWDRAETNGYAQHLTDDPLPGSPRHRVLLHVAFGDHQVSTVTAEVEARTVGARIHQPAVGDGRNPDIEPYWGLRALPRGPYSGSALVVWDSGTPAPPVVNLPPSGPQYGRDPHEDPRNNPSARVQKAYFLRDGLVIDVCADTFCLAAPAERL